MALDGNLGISCLCQVGQVKVAMQNGDFVLQKARAMMPAVDLQPNTPTPVRHRSGFEQRRCGDGKPLDWLVELHTLLNLVVQYYAKNKG
jgi:hypothetical protein